MPYQHFKSSKITLKIGKLNCIPLQWIFFKKKEGTTKALSDILVGLLESVWNLTSKTKEGNFKHRGSYCPTNTNLEQPGNLLVARHVIEHQTTWLSTSTTYWAYVLGNTKYSAYESEASERIEKLGRKKIDLNLFQLLVLKM